MLTSVGYEKAESAEHYKFRLNCVKLYRNSLARELEVKGDEDSPLARSALVNPE